MKTMLEIISCKDGSCIDEHRELSSQVNELPLAKIHQWLIPHYNKTSSIAFRDFIASTKRAAVGYSKRKRERGKGHKHKFTFRDKSVLHVIEYSSSHIDFS